MAAVRPRTASETCMRKLLVVGTMVCLLGSWLAAQGQMGTIVVQVTAAGQAVGKAQVVVGGETRQTDVSGAVQVQVPAGDVDVTVVKEGYVTTTVRVSLAPGAKQDVTIDLQPEPRLEEAVTVVATTRTNNNGRTNEPLVAGERFVAGAYELRFHVGEYFRGAAASLSDPPFLDVVPVWFRVTEPAQRYHVPLLVTPWSYSTYRGS